MIQTFGVLLSCLALLFASTWAEAEEHRTLSLWTVDLRTFSYTSRPNPHYIGGKPYISGKFADIGIIFRSHSEVICYFVTKSATAQLEHRGQLETSDPYQVQVLSLAAKSGILQYQKTLPARGGATSVMVNSDGQLIVLTGDSLRLYNRDFSVTKERLLPTGEHQAWTVRESPSLKTLGLVHYSRPFEHFEALSSTSLALLRGPIEDHLLPIFSISDIALVKPDPQQRNIFIRDFSGGWQVLPLHSSKECVSNPMFVNESEVVNACGHEVLLLSTSGKVVMRDGVTKKEHLEELMSVTPDGRFVALSAMQTKGGFMDYTNIKRGRTRILVYDTVLRTRVCSVFVDPIPQKDYDFALAPDGSTLVVMTDSQLKGYSIAADAGR